MTDLQIDDLYLHARDEQGRIQVRQERTPERRAMTEDEHVRYYRRLASRANRRRPGSFPDDRIEAKVAEIRAYHQRKRERDAGAGSDGPTPGEPGPVQ